MRDNHHVQSSTTPAAEYSQRQQARERRVAQLNQRHIRLGYLRLLTIGFGLILLWWFFTGSGVSVLWLPLPVLLFLSLIIYHASLLRQRAQADRAAEVYRRGLARVEDRWIGTGPQGERFAATPHLYASDLDLFGHASLFQLLSTARTRMGEDTLARWLLAPAPVTDLLQRHAAIADLRDRLDLREDMAILGADLNPGVHPEALTAWAESPRLLEHPRYRWLALAFALLAISTAILWATLGIRIPFFLILLLEGAIVALLHRRVQQVFHGTEHALQDLQLLSSLFARLQQESFEAAPLQALQQKLSSHHLPVSRAITQLDSIVQHIYSLDNFFVRLLDIPLLYSIQAAYAAEAWRSEHGTSVRPWLDTLGQLEALLALATYTYEHPDDHFPEFLSGPPAFHARQLGHPLLPDARCVRNDVTIGQHGANPQQSSVLLISGSNMSGKSTLMRAVGINTVLAMAGAPVRAHALQLTPLRVGASILINDSLQQGSSRFYAEITRLRQICDLATQTPPLLFLLDELLQGTNSKDRLTGAEGVVRTLIERGAIGIISTHDLALTHLGGTIAQHLHNMHLQDQIEAGKMKFDYQLREGVVTKSNGIELMRLIGLDV